jgi:hypothetical protein
MNIIANALKNLKITAIYRIVTSGYTDRYLMSDVIYSTKINDAAFEWRDKDDAIRGLAAIAEIAGESIALGEITEWVCKAPRAAWGHYEDGTESGTVRINPVTIKAVLDANNPSIRDEYREKAAEQAKQVTDEERKFIRWHLSECNRRNQRLIDAGVRAGFETQVRIDNL